MLAGSPNFSLSEVRNASHSVPWADVQLEPVASRVAQTLTMLEAVRATLGHRRITITSLVRSPEHNERVRGSSTSAHLEGYGADIRVEGMTPREVFNALKLSVNRLHLDQLIYEGDHVHLSSDPRARGQIIDLTGGVEAAPADATRTSGPTPELPRVEPPGCAVALVFMCAPWAVGVACYLTLT